MASSTYDTKTGKARVFFRFGGRQCNRTVKARSARERAPLRDHRSDHHRSGSRKALLAPRCRCRCFPHLGRKVVQSTTPAATPKALTLADVFEQYRAEPPPHLEASTRQDARDPLPAVA